VFFYNCSVFIYSTVAGHKFEINLIGMLIRTITNVVSVDHFHRVRASPFVQRTKTKPTEVIELGEDKKYVGH